ncbi:helix-turn-helix transcriptional regulator [Vibrio sp. SS-MA-C1-2]|uniref:AraC family transcriptional regulator n=1 Tax=Vibrio sp. SS-MA-C1-2 TaxID=2908646 RepID=UPI001F1D3FA1|nr:helix-turn-helix transcriptional regulator [Vibrio sp. SS-MA-C1-2]UJF16824.1 helix-turn-helix transcriptional regulator [Vibrio sp. SS-MA-C1-2]
MSRVYHPLFSDDNPPGDIFFGHASFLPNTVTKKHRHSWGQIQFIKGGILEIKAEGKRFLSPPQYAVWVPANIDHESYIRRTVDYCSMNITTQYADQLPNYSCMLEVSPIVTAIMNHIIERKITIAEVEEDQRLIKVIFDQMLTAKQHEEFLPTSNHKLLKPILLELQKDPACPKSLAQWAEERHTTERTLARHCQSELGMSLTEWRQRRKFIMSLQQLRNGESVKEIAFNLGYNQSSPFIALFKKHTGTTPEQYRQRWNLKLKSSQ